MLNKGKNIFIAIFCCAVVLAFSTGLYAIDYQYSPSKQATENFKIGLIFNNAQKYSKAIPYFEKALSADPEFAAALFEIAFAFQNTDNRDKAISYYKKGFARDKHFLPAYSQVALLYIERGEVFKSYQWLKKGQQLYPSDRCINQMIGSIEAQNKGRLALAEAAQTSGSNVTIGKSGQGVFIGPIYYKKDKMPVSVTEQRLYDEYVSKVEFLEDDGMDEKTADVQMLQWYEVAFKKYNINAHNFNHMLRKMAYEEVPPQSYAPPMLGD